MWVLLFLNVASPEALTLSPKYRHPASTVDGCTTSCWPRHRSHPNHHATLMEINKDHSSGISDAGRRRKKREKKNIKKKRYKAVFSVRPSKVARSPNKPTDELEISYPRQKQESLRSSSTWKIPYHPISSQAEGAGCCRGCHGSELEKRRWVTRSWLAAHY